MRKAERGQGRWAARTAVVAMAVALSATAAGAQVWQVGEQGLVLHGGPQANGQFGQVLASGDFNDDGYRDLAVGAPVWDAGAANAGLLEIYLGGANGLTFQTSSTGSIADMNYGAALAAGDFDGDGQDELVVGAPGWDIGGNNAAGRVYVAHYNGSTYDWTHWDQSTLGLGDEPDDRFGEVFAVGDFDNDGYEDLAIGMPHEDLSLTDSGVLIVIYGSASGLTATGYDWIPLSSLSAPEQANAGLGMSLAAGDFNGDDAYYDLALGAPGFDVSGMANAGIVAVLYGGAAGLSTSGAQVFNDGPYGTLEAGDNFGAALATGDFNRTETCWIGFLCRTDLVIGIPGQTVNGQPNAGRILVFYGGGGVANFNQGDLGSGSSPENGDRFGEVLLSEWVASANLNGTAVGFPGQDDLVIGVPGENWNGVAFQGVVHLAFGSESGLNGFQTSQWRIAAAGLSSAPPAAFDNFGYALALGDFNGNDHADVAIGVVGRDNGATPNVGLVQVMYGAVFADGFESAGNANWSAVVPAAPEPVAEGPDGLAPEEAVSP